MRYGSSTSSIVSRSSPIAAARLSTPTGPPANFDSTVCRSLRSMTSSPERIDVEHRQRGVGDRSRDLAGGLAPRRSRARGAAGDWRCAACRASGARSRCAPSASIAIFEQRGRAQHDARELVGVVELEPRDDAEAVAQRIGQHAGARRRAHQRERRQVELHAARRRSFADHDVDLEVLERGIQDLLDDRRQAMDLVDEQHVARLEVGQERGEIAGALEHRSRRLAQVDAELVREDVRQRGLAEARADRTAARGRALRRASSRPR